MQSVDVAIVGGGPAGLSLARSLAGTGLEVVVVERMPEAALASPRFDGREIALTHLSLDILRGLGAWDRIPASEISPLREAKVLSGHSPYALHFEPQAEARDVLGHLVPNHLIRRALYEATQGQPGLTLLTSVEVAEVVATSDESFLRLADGRRIRARLVVAADTRFSAARASQGIGVEQVDFQKIMMVARLAHERPHHHVATEWFGYGQTLALLPLNGNVSSAVLTLRPEVMAQLQAMDDEAFGAEMTRRSGGRLGRMQAASTRHSYPLVATYAERFCARRFAVIGDAAVGMHPVTAHGFNFGLRGQHILASEIRTAAARGLDIASPGLLRRYEAAHRQATRLMFLGTNAIARLYTDDRLPARLLRGAALRLGNRLPPFRQAVLSRLMEAKPLPVA